MAEIEKPIVMNGSAREEYIEYIKAGKKTGGKPGEREAALEVLRSLPMIDRWESGKVFLEKRLIGTFRPSVDERDLPSLKRIIDVGAALQRIIMNEKFSPSTFFDSENGLYTITTRHDFE